MQLVGYLDKDGLLTCVGSVDSPIKKNKKLLTDDWLHDIINIEIKERGNKNDKGNND